MVSESNIYWKQIQSNWINQKMPLTEKLSFENRLNDYFMMIRKKERIEFIELIFDLLIGALFILGGLSVLQDAFTFFWPLPSKEVIANYKPSLFSSNPGRMIYDLLGMSAFGLTLLIIGLSLLFSSIKLRLEIWRSSPIKEMSSLQWHEDYLDNKIRQANIGKRLALTYFILVNTIILYYRIIRDLPDNYIDVSTHYDYYLRILFMFLLPLSIYLVAMWQKKKLVRQRNELLLGYGDISSD